MNIRTILSAVALTVAAVGSSATAQTYAIGYDQTRYDAAPGDSVEVALVLTEDISDGGTSRLAEGGIGLFGFELGIDYSVFSQAAAGSTYASVDFNPGFFQEGEDFSGGFVTDEDAFVQFISSSRDPQGVGVIGTQISDTVFELELLTASFTAGPAGSITNLLSRNEPTAILGFPLLFADGAAPVPSFGQSQIFVNAVPEPGSAAFIALLAGAGLIKRRRK